MTDLAAPPPARSPASRRLRWLARQIEHGLAAAGLFFFIYHLGFQVVVIVSPSMAPTLCGTNHENGDWVLMEKLSLRLRAPRRWEVLLLRSPDGYEIAKRIVGLPGETIALRDGLLVIDGVPIDPPPALAWLRYAPYGMLGPGRVTACGDGYFYLGDHSEDSEDSRFEGPAAPADLLARAWLRLRPLARFGAVNP